jgi:hypothetical protein
MEWRAGASGYGTGGPGNGQERDRKRGTIREIRFALRSLRKTSAMTTAIGVAALRAE